ncbi:MAG: periplasmic heavy metal sensor [Bradyrhizobium sp.]|jgi:Spy/CpxP family protein refolding chaperone|uniref:Spy/CpxP family protein refolding chaperone n=1 Tax=Bradyrhizobium sp. TaxID=376 RepID=UPI001A2B0ED7|nr:periplasmic heavy metal sensor [Bradyrhizobium sp.]MBJ7401911.1 periplasmic heavy metal sensor [Bradyrhizobium sp.]
MNMRRVTVVLRCLRLFANVAVLGLAPSLLTVSSIALAAPSVRTAMMDDMGSMGGGQPGSMSGMSNTAPNASGGMSGTSGSSSGGMGGMSGGMGGCCMGPMGQSPGAASPSSSGMAMQTNLPGFPGASHIYHVGATGFYLDYADKLGLSTDQRTKLNEIKQQALLTQSNTQRKVDEAEQALWVLTAADQPDAAAIEAKAREIEKLKADQRIAFIRAVGDAANALTADQRKMVLGLAPMPSTTPAASTPAKPMNMGK